MATIIDIKIPKAIAAALRIPPNDPRRQQLRVLKKLLKKARFTEFGQQYHFDEALLSKHPGKKFQELVPVHDYNKIYEEWWKKTLDGVPDVTWPGKIKYYALSSGTSEAASKYIPVTKELLRSNTINYVRQFISLIKDSSLVSVIAITDLTKSGREIITSSFATFEIWFTVALLYLLVTSVLSQLLFWLERRFARSD